MLKKQIFVFHVWKIQRKEIHFYNFFSSKRKKTDTVKCYMQAKKFYRNKLEQINKLREKQIKTYFFLF